MRAPEQLILEIEKLNVVLDDRDRMFGLSLFLRMLGKELIALKLNRQLRMLLNLMNA